MPSQENLPNLVINEVESSAVFEWMKNQTPSLINDHELYLVTDPEASAGIDEVPTEGSKNLVYSGGVWAAIQQGGGADGKNSVLIEGGADATASQAIVDALPEDGRYVIEFTEETDDYEEFFSDINQHLSDTNNPHKVTAAQIGAPTIAEMNSAIANIPQPDVVGQIATHNTDTSAHNDIRQLIANKKGATIYEATIGTSWTEDSDTGVKYQTVSIDGITANNTAKVDHSSASVDGTSEGYATFVEEENQYLEFITNGYAETVAGGIKFTIFGDPNTVNIPIVVEVV